ncbi:putative damage-inducible protein DinB [Lysinibacillus composti]|uniref:Damage-inducible protein DinB n=1 Tax=Lysinibacillus composti TaxID=720633 RepID=A0A3N9UL07_9BACI|nr:DinB family protein [Lysinibacillus composti]MBM7610121.1 putative damage-inducible protein DinB [Lysinibacillus composti]RQW73232.1 damage-inducible protein DinB [Lysinibacillus composti]
MYRKLEDFILEWEKNCAGTFSIIESITEEKKNVSIVEGHSSLEWLSWHLTTAPAYFCGLAGLNLELNLNPANTPATIDEIKEAYKAVSQKVVEVAKNNLSDEKLLTNVDMHGHATPIGAILRLFVDHQTHHRAQMQVLLRQAGLNVPGVMGPTKEMRSK